MDYFLLKQDERCPDTPVLLHMRSQIDLRNIHRTRAHLIADAMVFHVRDEEQGSYPDILDRQVFLVSERLKRVIEMYEPDTLFKLFALTSMEYRQQHNYYLPIFEEVDALSPHCEYHQDQTTLKRLILRAEPLQGKKVFRIQYGGKPLIVARLDAAESLLRRDFAGIRMERVQVEPCYIIGGSKHANVTFSKMGQALCVIRLCTKGENNDAELCSKGRHNEVQLREPPQTDQFAGKSWLVRKRKTDDEPSRLYLWNAYSPFWDML